MHASYKNALMWTLYGVLFLLLISLFVMAISCLLGWVVAKIHAKLKHKNILTTLVALVLFGAYYMVCFRANELIEKLLLHLDEVGAAVRGWDAAEMVGRYSSAPAARAATAARIRFFIRGSPSLSLFGKHNAVIIRASAPRRQGIKRKRNRLAAVSQRADKLILSFRGAKRRGNPYS